MKTSIYQLNPTVLESNPPQKYDEYNYCNAMHRMHEELVTYFKNKIAGEVRRAEKHAAEPEKQEFSPPTKMRHLA